LSTLLCCEVIYEALLPLAVEMWYNKHRGWAIAQRAEGWKITPDKFSKINLFNFYT